MDEGHKRLAELAASASRHSARMTERSRLLSDKYPWLVAERDSFVKLYNNLWILFIGGFIYSLSMVDKYPASPTSFVKILIYTFRIIAMLGTALNFYLQTKYIDYSQLLITYMNLFSKYQMELSELQSQTAIQQLASTRKEDADNAAIKITYLMDESRKLTDSSADEMQKCLDKSTKLSNTSDKLEKALIACAATFLILALVLTWNIMPGVPHK